ncbi:hypothetical protein CTAYLR_004256 [Chrysophaeum taylorii]|uniref:Polyketide synthase n=1 Tax=Chrysophaeum taylorii TaxID=2483200 RepID=A0AAD7XM21_9STRA|nr:hypothetical protein CTAYLR_004256 [Chrysophaeum taylorii]
MGGKNTSKEEGIAVCGHAFRFPGKVSDADSLWAALEAKKVMTQPLHETGRWGEEWLSKDGNMDRLAGTWRAKRVGVVDGSDEFDASYFNLSDGEARCMDRQQRQFLELSIEALHRAGIPTQSMQGSNTGVWVGCSTQETLASVSGRAECIKPHTNPGLAQCVIANRVSFFLGCTGPSMAVDTACASTLTVVESAVAAMKLGRCDIAIVGGTNALLLPELTVGYEEMGVLAVQGMCRPFDAAASGYARAEGYGVVVLRNASSAVKAGNSIYAIVRAVRNNHCGNSSGGLTKPSQTAQAELVEKTWGEAGLDPKTATFVEAHGTGTPVGDGEEGSGIAAAFGGGERRVPFASSKATFGHMEPAAAMVSLVKACLIIDRRAIPPQAAWTEGNPNIDWSRVLVPTECMPVEPGSTITIGINAFGFGGSNSHCVLQEYDDDDDDDDDAGRRRRRRANENDDFSKNKNSLWRFGETADDDTSWCCVPFSAASAAALKNLVGKWAAASIPEAPAASVVAWQVAHRSHLQHRCCVVVASKASPKFGETAAAVVEGAVTPSAVVGKPSGVLETTGSGGAWRLLQPASVVVVFAGQGQQHVDMGRRLYATRADFRETIDECDEYYVDATGTSFLETSGLFRGTQATKKIDMNAPAYSVPSICFFQCAMFKLLTGLGLEVRCVVGHSLGELAAGFASGATTLEQTVRVATARAKVQQRRHAGKGGMVAVMASRETVEAICKARGLDELTTAAVNSATSVTMAGDVQQCATLKALCKSVYGLRSAVLRTACAYHSPYVADAEDELKKAFGEALETTSASEGEERSSKRRKSSAATTTTTTTTTKVGGGEAPRPLWISTVTGEAADTCTPQSLWDNVREPVAFDEGFGAAIEASDVVVEIAARPTLGANMSQVASSRFKKEPPPNWSTGADLKQGNETETSALLRVVGNLYVAGALPPKFSWARLNGLPEDLDESAPPPFKTAWAPADVAFRRDSTSFEMQRYVPRAPPRAPMLEKSGIGSPWILDHVVGGKAILPATAMLELVLETLVKIPVALTSISIRSALPIPDDAGIATAAVVRAEIVDDELRVVSASGTHCTMKKAAAAAAACRDDDDALFRGFETLADAAARDREFGEPWDAASIYARTSAMGFSYGPAFARCTEAYIGDDEALAVVSTENAAAAIGFKMNPCVLDAVFHAPLILVGVWSVQIVPVGLARVDFYRELDVTRGVSIVAHTVVTARPQPAGMVCDVAVSYADDLQNPVCVLRGIELAPMTPAPRFGGRGGVLGDDSLYRGVTQPLETASVDVDQLTAAYRAAAAASSAAALEPGGASLLLEGMSRIARYVGARSQQAILELSKRVNGNAPTSKFVPCIARFAELGDSSSDDTLETLKAALPFYEVELEITEAVLDRLPDIAYDTNLMGPLLYDPDRLPRFFDKSFTVDACYDGVAALVKRAVADILETQATCRVLEIGVRFGGLASRVAKALREDYVAKGKCQYVATDLASTFLGDAADILDSRGLEEVHLRRFDLETDPETQGMASNSFDVVVIMSTLHGVVDAAKGLANVCKLAKPGAIVLNVEPTRASLWWLMELWFGAMDVWWRFDDWRRRVVRTSASRPYNSCWCDQAVWMQLFESAPDLEAVADLDVYPQSPLFSTLVSRKKKKKGEDLLLLREAPPPAVVEIIPRATAEAFAAARPTPFLIDAAPTLIVGSSPSSSPLCAELSLAIPGSSTYTLEPGDRADDVLGRISFFFFEPSGIGGGGANVIFCVDVSLDNNNTTKASQSFALALVQAMVSGARFDAAASSLAFVVVRDGDDVEARTEAAFFRGLARPIAAEHTSFQVAAIDVDSNCTNAASLVADALVGYGASEPELTVDETGARTVPRVVRFHGTTSDLPTGRSSLLLVEEEKPPPTLVAEADGSGRADGVEIVPRRRIAATDKDVLVDVTSACLNFKDVMATLGLLDKLGGVGGGLGFGCFGYVAGGQTPVVALANRCIATKAACPETLIVPVPAELLLEKKKISPITWGCVCIYATAYDALVNRAKIGPGDVVLVHSAASAVGQAALHLAARSGASKVFATAGTPEKRRWLAERYGAAYPGVFAANAVGDSRNPAAFQAIIKSATGGEVDVVLSSLSGAEAYAASLSLLGPGGRFVDIAKRDMLGDSSLKMGALLQNVTYASCHLDLLAATKPDAARKVLEDVISAFDSGLFADGDVLTKSVPFEPAAVGAAVKEASGGRVIEKAVFDISAVAAEAVTTTTTTSKAVPGVGGGTYVVVGGLGGIGISVARGLASRGADRVVLVGRRATSISALTRRQRAEVRAVGALCEVRACDATDFDAVSALIEAYASDLKGVVHLGCVLADKPVATMTTDELFTPIETKARVALNLHKATLRLRNLEHFVVATSTQDLLGAGQGNYVAANQMAVDLCRVRKDHGLPGLAVALGPVLGAGMLERDPSVAKILKSVGADFVAVHEAAEAILSGTTFPYLMASRINGVLADDRTNPGKRQRLKWESLVLPARAASAGAGKSAEEKLDLTRKKLAGIFSIAPDEIDIDQPLINYGVDSLLGTELVNVFKRDFGVDVSFTDILANATIAGILGLDEE